MCTISTANIYTQTEKRNAYVLQIILNIYFQSKGFYYIYDAFVDGPDKKCKRINYWIKTTMNAICKLMFTSFEVFCNWQFVSAIKYKKDKGVIEHFNYATYFHTAPRIERKNSNSN